MVNFNQIISKFIRKPDHFTIGEKDATCVYIDHMTITMNNEHIILLILDNDTVSQEVIKINEYDYINHILEDLYTDPEEVNVEHPNK